jgi:hypothetical protein
VYAVKTVRLAAASAPSPSDTAVDKRGRLSLVAKERSQYRFRHGIRHADDIVCPEVDRHDDEHLIAEEVKSGDHRGLSGRGCYRFHRGAAF